MSSIYQTPAGQSVYDSGGQTYDAKTGAPVSSSPSQQSAVQLSVSGNAANALTPVTAPSVISSATGANIVANQTQKLAKLSAVPAPIVPVTPAVPANDQSKTAGVSTSNSGGTSNTSSSKVTLINPTTEQTVSFDNADLNKNNIQQYMDAGYKVSDASGSVPSWLSPTGVSTAQTATDKAQSDKDAAAAQLTNLTNNLTQFTVSDADLQQQIAGITALWNGRIADMQKVDDSRVGSITTLGTRLGSRFAGGSGGSFGGIISEEEAQGVQRIADLEGQKQSAIAAAKLAAQTQDWAVYSKQVDLAEKAYADKVQAVKDLQEATTAQNKLISDQLAQQNKDYYDQVTKPVSDIASIAAKYGASPDVLSEISQASSISEAYSLAGKYLQDPKAQIDLETSKLDNVIKQQQINTAPLDVQLKQAQINKTLKETAQIGQPTAAETKAAAADKEHAAEQIPALHDKIALIDSLLVAPGLNSAVGPNALSRIPLADAFGAKQDFIAGVSELTNQETLDALINLKAQGGTLGALSDSEGELLRSAATKIGAWQVKDGSGNITGYNTSETAFKKELNQIKTLANRALEKAQGDVLPADDRAVISQYYGNSSASTSSLFDPLSYY